MRAARAHGVDSIDAVFPLPRDGLQCDLLVH
jgi:hypothetical protein